MKILIITPAARGSLKGNRITAERWRRMLRELGHRVDVKTEYRSAPCDLLVALHARRSYKSMARFRRLRPRVPMLLALTGTDLYGDINRDEKARQALRWAKRLILLQSDGLGWLPPRLRSKARVIHQSAVAPPSRPAPLTRWFEVAVVGHLRAVKDPFRAALAARRLPAESRMRIVHVGAALSDAMRRRAEKLSAEQPRYRWLGELSRRDTLRRLARCRLLVLTSKMEGGANVISEALAAEVPILSTRISGSVGILGADYPGYFPVGDADALASLLWRAESDGRFYRQLESHCRRAARLVNPRRELESWRRLLDELKLGD